MSVNPELKEPSKPFFTSRRIALTGVLLFALFVALFTADKFGLLCRKEIEMQVVYGNKVEQTIRDYRAAGWDLEFQDHKTSGSSLDVVVLKFSRCKK